jgi:hypothetical protein
LGALDDARTLLRARELFPAHPRCRCAVYAWFDLRYARDAAPTNFHLWADDAFKPPIAPPEIAFDPEKHPRGERGHWSPTNAEVAALVARQRGGGPKQKELFPGAFPPIPEGVQRSTDFEKPGIEISGATKHDPAKLKKFLDLWNEKVHEAPEAFKKEFMGGLPGTMLIGESDYNSDAWQITGYVHDADGARIGEYTRTINFAKNKASSDYFKLFNRATGKDTGKVLLAGNMEVYKKLGLDAVQVHANIDVGGYAWAKYGYVPTESSWRSLSSDLYDKLGQGGGYQPESWEELSSDQQDSIFNSWIEHTRDDFYDSEVESWRENGQDLALAKTRLGDDSDVAGWAAAAVHSYSITTGEGEATVAHKIGPYLISKNTSVEAVLSATTVSYEDRRGDGNEDADVTIDDTKTPELTDDERAQIESIVQEAFNKKAEAMRDDIEVPDYIGENVGESQSDIWSSMRDRDKFSWARDNGELPEVGESSGGSADIDDDDANELRSWLDEGDPKAIWEIADSKHGKELLLGSDWYGQLDLHDEDTMARFNAYVGKAKRAKPAQPAA